MATKTKNALVRYNHDKPLTGTPKDYSFGVHAPLKMDDFDPSRDNYAFHAYKVDHLTYYANVTIGDRIAYHRECVALVDDPTKAAKMQMDKTIAAFMKTTGKDRKAVIALLQNA